MVATEAKAAGPTSEEVAATHAMALGFARKFAPRPDELTEVAQDAATDGVLWALKHFDATAGKRFEAFALSAVRRFVSRRVRQSSAKHHNRPLVVDLSDAIPARELTGTGPRTLPLAVRELPAELRDVVRLFFLDRFDLKDIGLLLGCSTEAARGRLRLAGRMLGRDLPIPTRGTGARRLRR